MSSTSAFYNTSATSKERAFTPPRLRNNFLWTLSGNVLYAASQWGILVILAKLGTPQTVGELALAFAITAPIMIGTGLSLRGVQATDATSEYPFADYLSLRLVTTAIAVALILGVVWRSGYGWHTSAIILLIGLAKAAESVSDVFYGLFQQRERMDTIACSMMARAVLSLVLTAAVIYLSRDLLFGAIFMAAVWTTTLLFYDIKNGVRMLRETSARLLEWRPKSLIRLSLLAAPVGIVMAMISFGSNIPRYFIEAHLGARELGIFAALAYPMSAGITIINALGQSATPRLARYFAEGDRRAFSILLFKLLCLGSAVGIAAVVLVIVAGRPILLLLYRPDYAVYMNTFLWLGIAAAIGYPASLLGFGMTAARYFLAQVPVFAATTLVTIVGCAILVPRFELFGAALALSVAAICQTLGSAAVILYALSKCCAFYISSAE